MEKVRVKVPAPPAPATMAVVRKATEPVEMVAPVTRWVKTTVPVTVPPAPRSSAGVAAPALVARTETVMVSPGAAEAAVAVTPEGTRTGAAWTATPASNARTGPRKIRKNGFMEGDTWWSDVVAVSGGRAGRALLLFFGIRTTEGGFLRGRFFVGF